MKYVKTNDGNIAAFVNGRSFYLTPDNMNYDPMYQALKAKDSDTFESYMVDQKNLNQFCGGYIHYSDGQPMWDGVPMPDLFTDRILQLVERGEQLNPMIEFTIRLAENESDHSILELLDFLRNKNLPITTDGQFLAYKVVKPDYTDIYTGKINNSVGEVVRKTRSSVDPNRRAECSRGLHVGALDYIKTYGDWNGGVDLDDPAKSHNKVIIVRVHPKDVVTVPTDHNFQKLRCCEYKVIAKFGGILEEAVYDETVFLKSQEPKKIEERPWGWKKQVKSKFARIANLVKKLRKEKNA